VGGLGRGRGGRGTFLFLLLNCRVCSECGEEVCEEGALGGHFLFSAGPLGLFSVV
jgi:hypothetical protein